MLASSKSSSAARLFFRGPSRLIPTNALRPFRFPYEHYRELTTSKNIDDVTNKDSSLPKGKWIRLKIDRTDLINIGPGSGNNIDTDPDPEPNKPAVSKEPLTALAKELQNYIFMRGPITLHDFVRQAANHALHGYYQNDKSAKIGEKGDFITAPEISHLFGEMITIWCVLTWRSLGSPQSIRLIELGPGNGTLMQDILNAATSFPEFKKALSVHMVELSEKMIQLQKEKLGCNTPQTDFKQDSATFKTRDGVSIQWHDHIKELPVEKQVPCLFIGQEFLDTFPVHQLVRSGGSWREKLVECDSSDQSPYHFRVVLAPSETPAVLITSRYEVKKLLSSFWIFTIFYHYLFYEIIYLHIKLYIPAMASDAKREIRAPRKAGVAIDNPWSTEQKSEKQTGQVYECHRGGSARSSFVRASGTHT